MIKVIIWKEWKGARWYLAAFVLLSTGIPMITREFPNVEIGLPESPSFYVIIFTAVTFSLFLEQRKSGAISFLFARPVTKPSLVATHYLAYLLMISFLILASLSLLGIYSLVRDGDFLMWIQISGFLSAPAKTLGGVALAFLFSFFLCNSYLLFGKNTIAIAMFAFAAIFFVAMTVALRWLSHAALPEHGVSAAFDMTFAAAGALLGAVGLWELTFDEIAHRKNRRWLLVVTAASIVTIALIAAAISV